MHKFKVHNLISFDICMHHETITTIKLMSLSITFKSFSLSYSQCNQPFAITSPKKLLIKASSLHVARSSGQSSVLILFDFSAAFDLIVSFFHFDALSSLGFQDTTLDWVSFYLMDALFQFSHSHYHLMLESIKGPLLVQGPLFLSIYTQSLQNPRHG